ncbi:MAG: hypothetical protein ACTSP4_07255 [Candidatus Hodarchaeales archaeon]
MADNDELMDLVQTSLKVLAKDIGERLKSFEKRISFLEESIKNLSPASTVHLTPEKEHAPGFELSKTDLSIKQGEIVDLSLITPEVTQADPAKDDKKKEDLLDAIKIIDSL